MPKKPSFGALPVDEPNPLQTAFSGWGIPWRATLDDLEERFGSRAHPAYGWDVVMIRPDPFPGLLHSIAANLIPASYRGTPDYLFGHFSIGDDPRTNIEYAAAFLGSSLTPALGGGTIEVEGATGSGSPGDQEVRFVCGWEAGPSAIRLSAANRPDHFSGQRASPYDRDPRLRTACDVTIYPGFRPAWTEQEWAGLRDCVRIMRVPGDRSLDLAALRRRRPSIIDTEFAREPARECLPLSGRIARSADGSLLYVCGGLLLVIPLSRVVAVEVDRSMPAKGRGWSALSLMCSDSGGGRTEKKVRIAGGARTGDMDAPAARLGRALDLPVRRNSFYDD